MNATPEPVAEPRTTTDMVRDLLRFVVEGQWKDGALYMGGDGYAAGCPDCEASDELTAREWRTSTGQRYERNTHKPGCHVGALILEARGYLGVEDPEGEIP
jgi:hypothetical protein